MLKKIEIKNLDLKIDNEYLLKNINLSIYENEIVGILGESGSGKTLTLKYILGILPNKAEIKINKFEKDGNIGVVFQNAFSLLNPTMKIKRQLLDLYYSKYKTKEGFYEKIKELFEKVNLYDVDKYLNKYPYEASGGENQRLAIAASLISSPSVFIADEITTALDMDSKIEVINLLKKLNKEYKMSIIFVTHEINLMKNFVDRIYVMYKGEIIESGFQKEIFCNPKEKYTKELISLVNKYYKE